MDPKGTKTGHQLTMVNREKLTLDGVTNVGSYDPTELLLRPPLGYC